MLLLTVALLITRAHAAPFALTNTTLVDDPDKSVSNVDHDAARKILVKVLAATAGAVILLIVSFIWLLHCRNKKSKAALRDLQVSSLPSNREPVETTPCSSGRLEGIRRSDSGASLKTLPEYQVNPAEGELRLCKADETTHTGLQGDDIILQANQSTAVTRSNAIESGLRHDVASEEPDEHNTTSDTHSDAIPRSTAAMDCSESHVTAQTSSSSATHAAYVEHVGQVSVASPIAHPHRSTDGNEEPPTPRSSLFSPKSANPLLQILPAKLFTGTDRLRTEVKEHRRNISAPIAITHLRVEGKAAGFTVQQVAFLSSVDSLGRYGVSVSQDCQSGPEHHTSPPPFDPEISTAASFPLTTLRNAPFLTNAERHRRLEQIQQL